MTDASRSPALVPIEYPPETRARELLELLDEIQARLNEGEARPVLGSDLSRQLDADLHACRQRLAEPFTLLVMGDFKRGKSTLINALLGAAVVTTNVAPETVTINHLRYGPAPLVEIYLPDGGRVRLNHAELAAERLSAVLERLPQAPSHVVVEYPNDWLRGLVLVDTPGLNDVLRRFDQQVSSYLPQADAVLYVISGQAPLSASERAFLRSAVRPQDFPKIFFIVNMLDSFHTREQSERVLASIRAKLREAFPEAPVLGLSALDEFSRAQGQAPPNPARAAELQESFAAFRRELQSSILLNREIIRLDRVAASAQDMLRRFGERVARLDGALRADRTHLEQAIVECQDQNSALFQQVEAEKQRLRDGLEAQRIEATAWMEAFLARLQTETLRVAAAHPLDDLQRHLQPYLQEKLIEALQACLAAQQAALLQLLGAVQASLLASLPRLDLPPVQRGAINLSVAQASFQAEAWNQLDIVSWVVTSTGLSLGYALVEQLVAGLLSTLGEIGAHDHRQSAYVHQLQAALPHLRQAVGDELSRVYGELGGQLIAQIQSNADNEIQAALAALQQARALREQSGPTAAAAQATLRGIHEQAVLLSGRLESLQDKLRQAPLTVDLATAPTDG